jgi:hypothetical protein
MDELTQLLHESFEYAMTNVHTSFPGTIVKYDYQTRRADIQPSLKRKLPNGQFENFPIVPDVPVRQTGTKKYTIHITPEAGDEVLCMVCERSTDAWRDNGGDGIEDKDPRRFALQDCFAILGLQPIEFIPGEEKGLSIIHKTAFDGDFVSSVVMDDNKTEVKYKEKADVLIEDDHIKANTEKCTSEMSGDVAKIANSKTTVKLNGAKFSVNNGGKSLYTIWHTLLQKLQTTQPTTFGSPSTHNFNPAITTAIGAADTELGSLMEA